jgi:plastocyanin
MSRRTRATIAIFGVAIILGACGSSGTTAPPATSAPAAAGGASAAVDISGFAFAPATVDVAKGTTVTWSNKDGTTHHITSGTPPTGDGKFDGAVAGGATFRFTFNDVGTFKYFCSIHTTMTGTITVK